MQQTERKRNFQMAQNYTQLKNANATKYTPRQAGRIGSQMDILQNNNRGKNAELIAYRRAQFNNSAMMMQPNYS